MDSHELEGMIRPLAETLQREANVRAVFGDPIALGSRSIVPVGVIHVALGGGGGSGAGPRQGGLDAGHGGAAALGFGLDVLPVGFVHEEDGKIVFTRIDAGGEGGGGLAKLLDVLRGR